MLVTQFRFTINKSAHTSPLTYDIEHNSFKYAPILNKPPHNRSDFCHLMSQISNAKLAPPLAAASARSGPSVISRW